MGATVYAFIFFKEFGRGLNELHLAGTDDYGKLPEF